MSTPSQRASTPRTSEAPDAADLRARGRRFGRGRRLSPVLAIWALLVAPLFLWLLGTRLRELFAAESVRRLQTRPLDWPLVFASDLLLVVSLGCLGTAALLALARSRRSVRRVFLALTAATCAVAFAEAVGHQFLMITGSLLDWRTMGVVLSKPQELAPVVGAELAPQRLLVLVLVPGILALIIVRLLPRLDRLAQPTPARRSSALVGVAVLGSVLLLASFLPLGPAEWHRHTLALLAPADVSGGIAIDPDDIDLSGVEDPVHLELGFPVREGGSRPNIVLLVLESTGLGATSLAPDGPDTTPFLAELAEDSVLAPGMRTVVSHTSKALVAIHCGIEPMLTSGAGEARPGAIPSPCLPELLKGAGYEGFYLQSATGTFEERPQLVRNMGYERALFGDDLARDGYERANYFGREDLVLLPALENFTAERVGAESPHLLSVLTNGPHHDYQRIERFGWRTFDPDSEIRNRYLNLVHYQDQVLRRIIELYRERGLYENTIFVILGDHGEAFGEHGRTGHDNVPWNEVVHVPFLIHDGRGMIRPRRTDFPTSQLDVVPTLLGLLGAETVRGGLPGVDLLDQEPSTRSTLADRSLFGSCWYERRCLTAQRSGLKLVHHYDRQPDEVFRTDTDPREKRPLRLGPRGWLEPDAPAGLDPVPDDLVEGLLRDAFVWRERSLARWTLGSRERLKTVLLDEDPSPVLPLPVRFGDHVEVFGYDAAPTPGRHDYIPGLTLYYRVVQPFDTLVGEREPTRTVDAGTELQHVQRYEMDPGPGLYPLRAWEAGDIVRDWVTFGDVDYELGGPVLARLSFHPGGDAGPLEPRWMVDDPQTGWGELRIEGHEVVFPIHPPGPGEGVGQWVLREREPPEADFVKVDGWQRRPVPEDGPIIGYVSPGDPEVADCMLFGWAGDDREKTAVDRIVAFHHGRPIAHTTPSTPRTDVTGYPEGTLLGYDLRLRGAACDAYRAGELEVLAERDGRFGRLVHLR